MPVRSSRLWAVLALLAAGHCLSPASAQTKPPQRTAQRSPASEAQPAADDAPPTKAAPRGASRAPQGAAEAAPGKGIIAPAAPFILTAAEEKFLNQVLIKWEKESDKIKTFKSTFDRWETDKTFGPKQFDYVNSKAKGNISYVAPDRGVYHVTEFEEWDPNKNALTKKSDGFDHWMCDGKSIFEYDHRNKRLIVRDLPPEMQGKAISDGPLPFVFGAKADALKLRYWMRDVTRREYIGKEVWLEAWPKRQQDKANFHHATLILTDPDFKPFALQIYLPDGKNHADYAFKDTMINDPLAIVKGDFLPPMTPLGWKRVVNPEATDAPKNPPPPAAPPAQAKRPAASPQRK
jgi:TIGR03009 family protein